MASFYGEARQVGGGAPHVPPLDAYTGQVSTLRPSALRRIVALGKDGVAWTQIARDLMISEKRIKDAFFALPEELR